MSERRQKSDGFDPSAPLSPEGLARREAMLPMLQEELSRRVAQRRRWRIGGAGAVGAIALIAVAGGAWLLTGSHQSQETGVAPEIAGERASAGERLAIVTRDEFRTIIDQTAHSRGLIERVSTTPRAHADTIVSTADRRHTVEIMDDRSLLRTLEEMGRPTGLARSEGRVWLTSDVLSPTSERQERDEGV